MNILGDVNCNLLDQTSLDNDAKHLLRILEIYQLTQLITNPRERFGKLTFQALALRQSE